MCSGGSLLVARTTLKRMICRVFGPKPGWAGSGCPDCREVVVDRVAHRERRRSVVVEDELLPSETAEVDDEVPALGRGGEQAAVERGWDRRPG